MDRYVTGGIIRQLREKHGMTQEELANRLGVTGKAVSKWETGKGYPDITLIEPIAKALGVSVMELLSGDPITNRNRSANMKRVRFYVCPICGNVIVSAGDALVCCHGISLPAAEAEEPDDAHRISVSVVEDELFVTLSHEMTKEHAISFLAAVSDDTVRVTKLYPEGDAQARFPLRQTYAIYAYCNHHGLFSVKV